MRDLSDVWLDFAAAQWVVAAMACLAPGSPLLAIALALRPAANMLARFYSLSNAMVLPNIGSHVQDF